MPYNRHHKGHRAQDFGWKGSSWVQEWKVSSKSRASKTKKKKGVLFHILHSWAVGFLDKGCYRQSKFIQVQNQLDKIQIILSRFLKCKNATFPLGTNHWKLGEHEVMYHYTLILFLYFPYTFSTDGCQRLGKAGLWFGLIWSLLSYCFSRGSVCIGDLLPEPLLGQHFSCCKCFSRLSPLSAHTEGFPLPVDSSLEPKHSPGGWALPPRLCPAAVWHGTPVSGEEIWRQTARGKGIPFSIA